MIPQGTEKDDNAGSVFATGGWCFDIAMAPRGRLETQMRVIKGKQQEYETLIEDPVWLATASGQVVKSRFVPPTKFVPNGRWLYLAEKEQPVAWMHYVKPLHPFSGKPSTRSELAGIMSTVPGADFLASVDTVGGE